MANMVNILNTIRANSSAEYQSRIPLATRENITEVGNPITTQSNLQNEFLTNLVNRIAMTVIRQKTFKNPLAVLKKGTVPLGSDIQEIFTNVAKGEEHDITGSKLLTRKIADTKALYHRVNRKGQYAVTITSEQLQFAFTSYDKLEEMLTSIITTLYSGDNLDEFILMKNVMADAVTGSKVIKVELPSVIDETTGKKFVKAVRNASSYMTYPSENFNTYFANKPVTDLGGPVVTWTPKEDQVLIVRSDILTEIDIEVLAQAFNLDSTKLLTQTMEIDAFGTAKNCMAMLVDRSWLEVRDNLYKTSEFYNPQGLFTTFYLTHYQTYSFSYFANAVAFVEPDVVG